MGETILIVDDEKLIRWTLAQRLKKEGYQTIEAGDCAEALTAFSKERIQLALLDLKLPDGNGISLLRQLLERSPDLPAVIITSSGSIPTAVGAMKEGAYDYITKPFNLDEMVIILRRALEARSLKRDVGAHVREAKKRFGLVNAVGSSPKMQDIFGLVRRLAASEAPVVLLRGESGTGKDVIASAIHYEGPRAQKPFVNITCTALQDSLLESELFGHEKGSFTDAKVQKLGLFEMAEGGTVFLDEIGDISPALQSKLLRVLEDRTFRRIGGTQDIKVDVRLIAATNRDLEKALDSRVFREDLYYRLNVLPIVIPPLRERREDIPLLVDHFIARFNPEFRKSLVGIESEALNLLIEYDWPGNIRELRNVIERACFLANADRIASEDLLIGRSAYSGTKVSSESIVHLPPEGIALVEVEKELIRQALRRTGWQQTRAAELLRISRHQLGYHMKKYGIREGLDHKTTRHPPEHAGDHSKSP